MKKNLWDWEWSGERDREMGGSGEKTASVKEEENKIGNQCRRQPPPRFQRRKGQQ